MPWVECLHLPELLQLLLVLSFGECKRSKAKHLSYFQMLQLNQRAFGADISWSNTNLCNELPGPGSSNVFNPVALQSWAVLLACSPYLFKTLFIKLPSCALKIGVLKLEWVTCVLRKPLLWFLNTQGSLSSCVACFILKGKWEFASFLFPLWLLEWSWEI